MFFRAAILPHSIECGPIETAWYNLDMVRIRFTDQEAKRKALAYLAGRFSFKSWATGEMLVPESALGELAVEGIAFSVERPAT